MNENRKLIAVDFDKTLTVGDCKWWEDGDEPIPHTINIEKVRQLYIQGHYIIIYTARPWEVARKTVAWLIKHCVRFHGVNFGKMAAAIYVDDRSVNWTN